MSASPPIATASRQNVIRRYDNLHPNIRADPPRSPARGDHRVDLVDKREPSGLSSSSRETVHLSFAIRQESLHNPIADA